MKNTKPNSKLENNPFLKGSMSEVFHPWVRHCPLNPNFAFKIGVEKAFLIRSWGTNLLDQTGFTLIELLLVVVILIVVAGFAIPNFSSTYQSLLLRETIHDLAYVMRYAQSRAITQGKLHRLRMENGCRQYWIEEQIESTDSLPEQDFQTFRKVSGRAGKIYKIPDGIRLECPQTSIHFYPEGHMDKGNFYACREQTCFTVSSQIQRGFVHVVDYKLP